MSSLKEQFPYALGWIHGIYTLYEPTPLSEDQIKRIATMGNPEKYEFGKISQAGKKLSVISRKLPEPPVPQALCDDCLTTFPLPTAEICPVCRHRLCPACREQHHHDSPATGVMGVHR